MRTLNIRRVLFMIAVGGVVCSLYLASADPGRASGADTAAIPSSPPVDAGSAPTLREDWPVFRGDMALRGYRKGTVGSAPKLDWSYDAGTPIESTAAVVGGWLYVGTDVKGLLALDASNGKVRWSFPCEVGIRTSPGVSGGRVYFGDDEGIFRAVDAEGGKLAWKFDPDTGAEILSSATFYGDLVLFGSYDGCLYALSQKDGTLRWKATTDGPVHCTPAIGSGHTFVAGCDEQLRTISLDAGKEVGALPMGAYSAASPAILGDRLFVGTFAPEVLCVRWRGDDGVKAPGPAPRGTSQSKSAASIEWTYEHPRKKFPFYSSAAVAPVEEAGVARRWVVVVGGRDKMVHALDAKSGESLWTYPTRAGIDGSPVVVGSYAIVGGLDGNLYCFELLSGKEHWVYKAGTPFRASPSVAGGKLYIASDEGLIYCFDLNPERK